MLDFIRGTLRSAIGAAEEAEHDVTSPMQTTHELEQHLADAVTAVHRSCDSMERHIAVLETLADSLAPLTESVTRLTNELAPLARLAAPIGAAEQEVGELEHEVSRFEHLLGRHRHQPDEAPTPEQPQAPPSTPRR
jgi:hypothetical protein